MKIQGGAIIARTEIRSRKIAKGNICTLARRLSGGVADVPVFTISFPFLFFS